MNFEKQTRINTIWFYRSELMKVKRGENPTEFFTKHQRRGLRKKGILVIAGNKIILTETAIKLLEAGHDE